MRAGMPWGTRIKSAFLILLSYGCVCSCPMLVSSSPCIWCLTRPWAVLVLFLPAWLSQDCVCSLCDALPDDDDDHDDDDENENEQRK